MNFSNNKREQKIAETLWIKGLRPKLNKREKSIRLRLFNETINKKYCNQRAL